MEIYKYPLERGSKEWIDQIEKEHYVLYKMQQHISMMLSAYKAVQSDLDEFDDIRVKPIEISGEFFE